MLRKIASKILKILPDKIALQLMYYYHFHKFINFKNPKTFNEKLQWLKLNDRNPIYTVMVDKLKVRNYVINKIGEEYVIPLINHWDNVDDINIDTLPEKFVMKCNHDSGGVVICKDKSNFNFDNCKMLLKKHLKNNGYWYCREWPYKNVKPCIICEKYMQDKEFKILPVFKFFCFNGEPKLIQYILNDKSSIETVDYYDIFWNKLDIKQVYPNSNSIIQKPKLLNDMIELSKKLSKGFNFLRVDFYIVNEKIYFSEFTFYPDAGVSPFVPNEWDNILGEYLTLRDFKNER